MLWRVWRKEVLAAERAKKTRFRRRGRGRRRWGEVNYSGIVVASDGELAGGREGPLTVRMNSRPGFWRHSPEYEHLTDNQGEVPQKIRAPGR
jgi:hypothetical protein